MIKIAATRCHILPLKCTKFDFSLGSAPDPAGKLTALPRPPRWIQGATSKRTGREWMGEEGKKGGRGRDGMELEGRDVRVEEGKRGKGGKLRERRVPKVTPSKNPRSATDCVQTI